MSTTEPATLPEGDSTEAAPTAAVVVRDPSKRAPAITNWDADFQRLVKLTLLKPKNREATGAELAMFAEQVQRTGLDPFFKQIYGIFRYDSRAGGEIMQVQAGIDGFRLIAERTGKYEGQTPQQWCGPDRVWHEVWTADGPPTAARVGVYKKGRREPTYAVAHWREYVQTNRDGKPSGKWADMGANQLSKCSEALALRKAFPAELSGLYTPEEMEQAANDAASLSEGTGDGRAQGFPLGDAVEAVIARAEALGHHSLAQRATIEMRICDAQGHVIPGQASQFVKDATADLDRLEESRGEDVTDAVVVEPPASEAVTDAERIAEMRRRGSELLTEAEALRDAGDPRADEVFERFERIDSEIAAASNVDQGSLPL